MTDAQLAALIRPRLAEAIELGRKLEREAQSRTFSDTHEPADGAVRPTSFYAGAGFTADDCERFSDYFSEDDDGYFAADLHRYFGLSVKDFADRSHLVRKQITNKNGNKQWVWVSPNKGKHAGKDDTPARTPEYHPTRDAETAVAKAEGDDATYARVKAMTADEVADLAHEEPGESDESGDVEGTDFADEYFTLEEVNDFAARAEGSKWQTNGRWYQRTGGKTVRIASPDDAAAPASKTKEPAAKKEKPAPAAKPVKPPPPPPPPPKPTPEQHMEAVKGLLAKEGTAHLPELAKAFANLDAKQQEAVLVSRGLAKSGTKAARGERLLKALEAKVSPPKAAEPTAPKPAKAKAPAKPSASDIAKEIQGVIDQDVDSPATLAEATARADTMLTQLRASRTPEEIHAIAKQVTGKRGRAKDARDSLDLLRREMTRVANAIEGQRV